MPTNLLSESVHAGILVRLWQGVGRVLLAGSVDVEHAEISGDLLHLGVVEVGL